MTYTFPLEIQSEADGSEVFWLNELCFANEILLARFRLMDILLKKTSSKKF